MGRLPTQAYTKLQEAGLGDLVKELAEEKVSQGSTARTYTGNPLSRLLSAFAAEDSALASSEHRARIKP